MASHAHEHGLFLDPAALTYSWAEPDQIPPQLLVALGEYLSSSSPSAGHGDTDAEGEADDEFMMYEFKVRRCARARSHDWTACPYAHPGEAARRRDPRRVAYSGDPCPDFRRRPGGAACPRGTACPLAHGTFELWLHPSRYRTRPLPRGPRMPPPRLLLRARRRRAPLLQGREYSSPLALSPKSTLTSLWESPPVSPVEGRVVRWGGRGGRRRRGRGAHARHASAQLRKGQAVVFVGNAAGAAAGDGGRRARPRLGIRAGHVSKRSISSSPRRAPRSRQLH
ncbi:hypothetical protein ACQ4PT_041088 [Festuca glaucescens]